MVKLFDYFHLSIAEGVLILVLFGAFAILQLYLWNVFGRVAFFKQKKELNANAKAEGISVVICARNEKKALEHNLPAFLNQEYPEFEVIVVNDCSEDDSELLLGEMKPLYPQLEVRNIVKDEIFAHGKTMALGVGIKAAKYSWVLFSDIDSAPKTSSWLASMQKNFDPNTSIVLGYASYPKAGKFVRSNMLFSALHYLGFALMKKPYRANEKNYAYRRQLFFDAKGFDIRTANKRQEIVFIGSVANKQNTKVELHPDSFVQSDFTMRIQHWYQHKLSEKSSLKFSGKKAAPAFWYNLSMLAFLLSLVLLSLQSSTMLIVAASFFVALFTTLAIVLAKTCRRLKEKKLAGFLIFYAFIAPFTGIWLYLKRVS